MFSSTAWINNPDGFVPGCYETRNFVLTDQGIRNHLAARECLDHIPNAAGVVNMRPVIPTQQPVLREAGHENESDAQFHQRLNDFETIIVPNARRRAEAWDIVDKEGRSVIEANTRPDLRASLFNGCSTLYQMYNAWRNYQTGSRPAEQMQAIAGANAITDLNQYTIPADEDFAAHLVKIEALMARINVTRAESLMWRNYLQRSMSQSKRFKTIYDQVEQQPHLPPADIVTMYQTWCESHPLPPKPSSSSSNGSRYGNAVDRSILALAGDNQPDLSAAGLENYHRKVTVKGYCFNCQGTHMPKPCPHPCCLCGHAACNVYNCGKFQCNITRLVYKTKERLCNPTTPGDGSARKPGGGAGKSTPRNNKKGDTIDDSKSARGTKRKVDQIANLDEHNEDDDSDADSEQDNADADADTIAARNKSRHVASQTAQGKGKGNKNK
jgi:hypothetical protein